MTAAAIDRFGRIDILLNNAGYGLMGAVDEATVAEVEAVFSDMTGWAWGGLAICSQNDISSEFTVDVLILFH